jgi:hypothetical protein
MPLLIRKYCDIGKQRVVVDGHMVFGQDDDVDFRMFLKSVYRHFRIDYPKFFKMDGLSKLGFLTADILLGDLNLPESHAAENCGIILTNASSSIDIDKKHFDTIKTREQYFPSPSNFVYTLPNIMAGEIAIRHGLKGENSVLISRQFNPELIVGITRLAFETASLTSCICGWVELNDAHYESLLFLVEEDDGVQKSPEDIIFDPLNLMKRYKALNEWKN